MNSPRTEKVLQQEAATAGSQNERPSAQALPSRKQAEEDEEAFFRLVDYVFDRHRKRRLTLAHVVDALGIDEHDKKRSVATASRLLDPKFRRPGRVTAEQRKWIVDKIYMLRLLYGTWLKETHAIPHSLFYAMVAFFNINESSIDKTRVLAVGTYKFWRYSADSPDHIVIGRWDIGVVRPAARPDQEHDGDIVPLQLRVKQVRKERPGQRAGMEVLDGFFFRIANHYFALIREHPTNYVRCIFFKKWRVQSVGSDVNPNSIYPANTNHLSELEGFAVGLDGEKLFFSPHIMQLVEDQNELDGLDDTLDIVPAADVPPHILKQLKEYDRIIFGERRQTGNS